MNKSEVRQKMGTILSRLSHKDESSDSGSANGLVRLPEESKKPKGWIHIRDIHKKLLASVGHNPFYSISEHTESIGNTSPWAINKTAEELIKLGFLEEPLSYSLGRRGNPRRFWRISSRGADHIGMDYQKCKPPGKGKFEHCLYQHIVLASLKKQGRSGLIEHFYNGKAIDVAEFRPNGVVWGFEIELRKTEHIFINLKDDWRAGCERVYIVTRNKTEQKRMMDYVYANLQATLMDKVSFKTIAEFN